MTKTRSAAQVLSGHTAVIWVDDTAGCYSLDRIKARKCRICGCHTFHACKPRTRRCPFEPVRYWPGCFEDCPDTEQCPNSGCHWVEPDLCSACQGKEGQR